MSSQQNEVTSPILYFCTHVAVPFTLSEVLVSEGSRLFFTRGDPGDVQYDGTFTLLAPNIEASQMLTVYARV